MSKQQRQITDHYNALARKHADPVSQSAYFIDGIPVNPAVFDAWANYIQTHFNIRQEDTLLDVGCGSGLFLQRFACFTERLYGVDPAEDLLKAAAGHCASAILKKGDTLNAGFDGLKFSRIFCNGVFLYLDGFESAERSIAHFLDISTNDAVIWLGELPMENKEVTDAGHRRKEKSTGWLVQHYPVEVLTEICTRLGVEGRAIPQSVEGKLSAAYRYDFLIKKTLNK